MEFTKEQMSKALDEAYKKAGHNAYFANGFEAGVNFTQEQFEILNIPCVSQQRELLVAFVRWLDMTTDNSVDEDWIAEFLSNQ